MKKIFKKFVLAFSLILVMSFVIFTSACNNEKPKVITKEDLEALVFEDLTVEYDGESHSIFIEDLPEGVKASYVGNDKTFPGEYEVTVRLSSGVESVYKTAKLIIDKKKSEINAESPQTVIIYGGHVLPTYTLNNNEQSVDMKFYKDGVLVGKDALYSVGTYTVEMYAKESTYYKDSQTISVELNVKESLYGLSFGNVTVEADGTEKEIVLTGDLPEGYTVKYTNNKGTLAGNYLALAEVCDASGKVVETHAAVLEINNPKNAEFDKYLDDFFVEYLEGDQLSVNIFCVNPSDFGLEHYEASWYTYTASEDYAADLEETKTYFNELLDELHTFKDAELSDLQIVAYNRIDMFLTYYLNYYNIPDSDFMNIVYVDQFGGYVADFGTYMEAYSLRSELEVQDVVDYITSTKTAFPSYLDFINDKSEAGYPLSDFTITEMRNYLSDILKTGENYYLKDILNEKIDGLDFLDESQKESYKNQIANAIAECFVPGVQELYDGLETYIGKLAKENEGYWAVYENGKAMYELELENLLGLDLDMDSYIKEVDSALKMSISQVVSTQQAIVKEFNISTYAELEDVLAQYPIYDATPEEMLVYLRDFAKTIVPELETTPDITVKEMDAASAKVSNAVAYYMKSALDNTKEEYITLNPLKLGDKNDVLGTLSHEGYPGHLYAYVFSKQLDLHNVSKIMTSTAHGEGWATYVELKLYEYAMELSDDKKFDMVMEYLYANQVSGFLLETRLDAGIHYQGWGVDDVAKYMGQVGYSSDGAQGIYDLLIEMPSGYAAYGYGKLTFINIHKEAQRILGGAYNEIEFNAMLLSKGWTSLGELYNTYNEYMTNKCHQLGIAYN